MEKYKFYTELVFHTTILDDVYNELKKAETESYSGEAIFKVYNIFDNIIYNHYLYNVKFMPSQYKQDLFSLLKWMELDHNTYFLGTRETVENYQEFIKTLILE